jgi:hypothetical protein
MTGSLNHRRLLCGAHQLNKRQRVAEGGTGGSAGRNSGTVWTGQDEAVCLL